MRGQRHKFFRADFFPPLAGRDRWYRNRRRRQECWGLGHALSVARGTRQRGASLKRRERCAVLECFRQVRGLDAVLPGQVSDRPGNAQDPVNPARREMEMLRGALE